jgi:hypothetical protein
MPKREKLTMPGYGTDGGDESKLLTWDWVCKQMTGARNYWVGTTRPDGSPHAAPVWGIWANDTLYFATATTSQKGRNLTHDSRVVIHLESGDETVIFEGTVVTETDVAVLTPVVDQYEAKYAFRPNLPPGENEVWYTLAPVKALAWLEADFPNTATRFTFGADEA